MKLVRNAAITVKFVFLSDTVSREGQQENEVNFVPDTGSELAGTWG